MFKFTNFDLKIIALLSMVIDHIGVFLFPQITILRYIGRLAFIIYAFLISQGYAHTRNVYKYLLRLGILALISQLPDIFGLVEYPGNIFILFVISILFLMNIDSKLPIVYKLLYGMILLAIIIYVPIDYGIYGFLVIMLSSLYTRGLNKYLYAFLLIALIIGAIQLKLIGQFEIFGIFALIPILNYNQKLGYRSNLSSFCFYISYPAHIAIIFGLSVLIQGL